MLVYLKEPMGITTIDGVFLTGEYYNYGRHKPANVSTKFYARHKDVLREIPITKEWLEKHFGPNPPVEKFLGSEIFRLSMPEVIKLAQYMGIKYRGKLTHNIDFDHRKALYTAIKVAMEKLGVR